MKKHLLILVALMLASSNAFAMGHFSLVGGIDYNLNSTSVNTGFGVATAKGGLGFGGGALIGLGVFEIGALYLSKPTTVTFAGLDTTTSSAGIEIPVMYRFGGLTSFGIGGFYDIATSSGGTSNYGITAGPRLGMASGLFLDLRFDYGLKTGNSKDLLALVGYSFGK